MKRKYSTIKEKFKGLSIGGRRQRQNHNVYQNLVNSLKRRLNNNGFFNNLIIFDIGAYKGTFTLALSEAFPESRIFAFEPTSDSFKHLSQASNGHEEIRCFQYAVGNEQKKMLMNLNRFDETNSLLPSQKTSSYVDELTTKKTTEEVAVRRLDDVCSELSINRIDLLKVDVQRFELEVLRGAENLLKNKSIKFIYCEVEFIEIYKDQPLIEDIMKFLRGHNYEPVSINNVNYIQNENIAWCDVLFTRK